MPAIWNGHTYVETFILIIGLPPVVGAGISTTKRSKFKERKLEHNVCGTHIVDN